MRNPFQSAISRSKTAACNKPSTKPVRLSTLATALLLAGAAWAQGALVNLDIPAQPLDKALNALALQSNARVVFATELTDGKTAPALKGTLAPREALDRLLTGSGLRARQEGQTLTVERVPVPVPVAAPPASPSDKSLPTVTVKESLNNQIDPASNVRLKSSNVATKLDTDVLETPATINTVTLQTLEDRAIREADKALIFVPGVSYSGSNTGGATEEFVIRGFSTNRRIFIDGYRNSIRFNKTDLMTVERIDVLKGSSSVLYGTAFPGGLVNYTTKKPQADASTSVSLTAGSYSHLRAEVDSTGALNEDKTLLYRLIAGGQNSNQSYNGRNNDASENDRRLVSLGLRWQMPNGGRLDYGFEYYNVNQPFATGIVFTRANGFNFNSPAYISEDSSWDHWNRKHKLEYVQPFAGDWQLLLGGTYHDSNWNQFRDATSGPATILNGGLLNRTTQANIDQSLIYHLRAEVSGKLKPAPWLELRPLFGAEYVNDEFDIRNSLAVNTPNSINPITPVFGPTPTGSGDVGSAAVNKERALFVQNLAKIHDKFNLVTGLRYLQYKRQVSRGAATANLTPKDSAIDYTISAIYNQSNAFSPFVGYSTSTEIQLATLNTGDSAPPRESKQIELGVKSSLLDDKLLLSAALFRIDQDNVVETIPGTMPAIGRLVGAVRSQGFEFELTGNLSPRLSVYGGYAYTDAFVNRSVVSNGGIPLQGKPLVAVPRHQFSVYGNYRLADVPGLSLNVGLIRVVDRTGDNVARFTLPDYTRFDVGARYQFGQWTGLLAIENLLDKNYVVGSSDASFVYQGARRSVTAKLTYTF